MCPVHSTNLNNVMGVAFGLSLKSLGTSASLQILRMIIIDLIPSSFLMIHMIHYVILYHGVASDLLHSFSVRYLVH